MPQAKPLLNPIDRLVAYFSPQFGRERAQARKFLEAFNRAHEFSSPSHLRKFHRDTLGPNAIVGQGAAALRAQARHLHRNNDIARGILRTMVNNIVGSNGIGIEPQPRRADGSIHEDYAAELREAWRDWCFKPEVTQIFHFGAVQRMMALTWLRDGEGLAQELLGPVPYLDHGTRVPYSLELFEPDMVPFYDDPATNTYQGIQRNAWGKPVSYWVYKTNPLDAAYGYGGASTAIDRSNLKQIDASRIIHIALRDRIGQMRGLTEFASVIGRLADMGELEGYELQAAKVAASLTAWVKKGSPDDYSTPTGTDANGNPLPRDMQLEAGMVIDGLAPGEDVGIFDSNRPNPNIVPFRQGQLRAVAAGVGASYSSIAKSYDGTYSAQRQELVEQWVNYATLTDEFTGQFMQPIWASFVQAAHLSGVVRQPKDLRPGSADDALFLAQSMPWIDPLKEAEAYTALVQAGFASEVEVMRKRGVNPRDVLDQIVNWRQKCKDNQVQFSSDIANKTAQLASAKDAARAASEGQA